MNRTFLILLMTGTAMMITVIGQHKSVNSLDYTPWEIDRLQNGSIRVLGITLGKTTIQEANQIFASFAQTRLIQLPPPTDTPLNTVRKKPEFQLIARYNDLNIGGMTAEIQLKYQLDSENIRTLRTTAKADSTTEKTGMLEYEIDKQTEINYLSTAISGITYIPSIDYGDEVIRQRFGQATQEVKISENERQWLYPKLGLSIFIYADRADRFVYSK
ncbi:hypothetical protein MNBD_GAMMA11-1005 [hydrothermal vent metagenome]|uniref:Uncharacterized protein n=1 Tax=hydrothermal vent metagenome TaxID=652676 RepID=A0A3B0XCI9_9ZZZZ